jgi:exodeoxyribonuclease VII large subunit
MARRLVGAAIRASRLRRESLARSARRLGSLHPAQALAQRTQRLDELQTRAQAAMHRAVVHAGERVARQAAELTGRSPTARIAALTARITQAGMMLAPALRHRLAVADGRLRAAASGLHATSPLATLARGYAIVTLAADRRVVTDGSQAPAGTEIDVRLARGRLRARVTASGG